MAVVLRLFRIFFGLAAFVLLWQAVVTFFEVPRYMLPSPFSVLKVFETRSAFLFEHAAITAQETLIGFLAGILLGAIIAIVIWYSYWLRQVLLPVVLTTQAMPVFAIAPILVLWLGFGLASKIVMAVLIIFFSVTSAFFDGLKRTDPGLVDLARLYRVSKLQELVHFRLPDAMPALASGIRIAAVFAPIGAIVGEWVGAKGGLAFVMLQANARTQTDVMFAALILVALMVLCLRFITEFATRRMVYWVAEDH